MPNWCNTNIKIMNDDSEVLENLFNKIKKWESESDNNWLGDIIKKSEIGNVDDFPCRGWITSLEYECGEITIDQDDAWYPNVSLWLAVIRKYASESQLFYWAWEPGCELCITNDPDEVGAYWVDAWDSYDEYQSVSMSRKHVTEMLQEVLNTKETDFKILLNMLSESEAAEHIAIHEWEYRNEYEVNN